MPDLEIETLSVCYGHVEALRGVTLRVKDRQVVSLVGANGAGKTTLMKTIAGLIPPLSGKIRYNGMNIDSLRADEIIRNGISYVPEGRAILNKMTVLENLLMGAYIRQDREVMADLENILEKFPILGTRKDQLAGTLSGGEQQLLAIGRALMSKPKFILFDEPSLGLAPIVIEHIFEIIKDINESGVTIMLVEQNVHKALSISDYAYVMETGKIAMEGNSKELLYEKRVMDAYLGKKAK
ncbi:MAG: ABC transporter ATP-binding protein [Nitrospirae bacterium]|nr:ABC transporter ATP-binding protein [Nitrospirota bacterium]